MAGNVNLHSGLVALYIFAMSSTVTLCYLKDFQGDRLAVKMTLPAAYGLEKASTFAATVTWLPLTLYWIPPVLLGFSPLYWLVLAPAVVGRVIIGARVHAVVGVQKARESYNIGRGIKTWDIVALTVSYLWLQA